MNTISIASSAMIGSLNISVWEARKLDKNTQAEVLANKGAKSRRAATVSKHLFSECPSLEAIKTLRGEARVWFNNATLPWDDNGGRLITTAQYLRVMEQAAKYEQRFNDLLNVFVNVYGTEISKQAFEMGALFDRSEYPPVSEVRGKFRFVLSVSPVPLAGDFRVDIGNEAAAQLKAQYERALAERVSGAVADTWQRVKAQVEWVHERMTAVLEHDPDAVEEQPIMGAVKVGTEEVPVYDDYGNVVGSEIKDVFEEGVVRMDIKKKRRPKLYDSMLEQGLELCAMLRDLNVTNDPRLEAARQDLETALTRVDIDSLKESTELQRATKSAMQDILDKFAL
jgi:hypothetical protein